MRTRCCTTFYVAPEARRGGVGQRLLQETLQALEALGAPRMVLSTRTGNDSAERLFAAAGFRSTMHEMMRERAALSHSMPKRCLFCPTNSTYASDSRRASISPASTAASSARLMSPIRRDGGNLKVSIKRVADAGRQQWLDRVERGELADALRQLVDQ
ncbi:MAG: GNAT family N-acetyltransferase [Polyangiaceae bacterium]